MGARANPKPCPCSITLLVSPPPSQGQLGESSASCSSEASRSNNTVFMTFWEELQEFHAQETVNQEHPREGKVEEKQTPICIKTPV